MMRFSLILELLVVLIMTSSNLYAAGVMIEGINYGFDGDYASVIRSDSECEGEIIIPSKVTYLDKTYIVSSISTNAFRNCINLNSVTIPNSVIDIGFCAFQGCSGLTSVTIPRSVTFIGESAFDGCSNLSTVHITDLGAWCRINFESQSSNPLINAHHLFLNGEEIKVLEIPNTVMSINYPTFCGFSGFSSVIIPNNVTSIGDNAFSGCSGLTTVVLEIEKPFKIDNSVFEGIPSDAQLVVPKGTKAAYHATEGWNKFTNIVEAGDDPTISGQYGDNVYYSYDKMTHTLTISGEGSMYSLDDEDRYPWWSFWENIQYIKIELGVTNIGDYAFFHFSGLTSITIPSSVTSIGQRSFENCTSLTSLVIPNSVTSIGIDAFSVCSGLTSIKVESGNNVYDSRGNCNAIIETSSNTLITGCKNTTIPNSVTSIGHYAFSNCTGLTSLVIPNSVTSIGHYAFSNCTSLSSLVIPNSVTSVGKYTFYNCSSLTSVVSEIEDPFAIDNDVFYGVPSNATLIVPKGTKAAYQATEGWNQFTNIVEAGDSEPDQPGQIHINDIFYKVTESGEAEVVSVEEGETSVTIPSTISYNNNTYKVTSIAKEVFENREHLAAVIWEPEAQFNAKVNNPNFLLYVSDEKYASHTVKNVVVNGVAENIELTDAANGNDFYCPKAFKAKSIIYSHNYQMETGLGDSRGWETIVLPFDVQKYTHATKGELESFTTWSKSSSKKPFWLFELTASGYKDVAGLKANTPYIISLPNNQQYEQQYQIPGVVTFSASDVEVQKSDNLKPVSYQGRTFVPNYTNQNNADFLALNVNNNYVTNPGKDISGSKFVRGLRAVHPFEAYMTTTDNTRSIDVMDGMTTAIRGIQMVKDESSTIKVYDTRGVLLKTATSMDDVKKGLKAGVYIVNGKKMIIK